MVGQGVLRECLRAPDVEAVQTVGRTRTGQLDPRLVELILPDLMDYRAAEPSLKGFDACFFCLGVSSAGMQEADYARLTYDLTLAVARHGAPKAVLEVADIRALSRTASGPALDVHVG